MKIWKGPNLTSESCDITIMFDYKHLNLSNYYQLIIIVILRLFYHLIRMKLAHVWIPWEVVFIVYTLIIDIFNFDYKHLNISNYCQLILIMMLKLFYHLIRTKLAHMGSCIYSLYISIAYIYIDYRQFYCLYMNIAPTHEYWSSSNI